MDSKKSINPVEMTEHANEDSRTVSSSILLTQRAKLYFLLSIS